MGYYNIFIKIKVLSVEDQRMVALIKKAVLNEVEKGIWVKILLL